MFCSLKYYWLLNIFGIFFGLKKMGNKQAKPKVRDKAGFGSGSAEFGGITRNLAAAAVGGGQCSYTNFCQAGQSCFNCNCETTCLSDNNCPPGTHCAAVSNGWSSANICVPNNQPVPIATGISQDYLQFLVGYPPQLLQYFVTNYSTVDLSSFGVPGPQPGQTRGPLTQLNTNGEITGSFSVIGINTDFTILNIQGLQNSNIQLYPGAGQTVTVPNYGTVPNLTSSSWDYDTGELIVNTVLQVTIPTLTLDMRMSSICPEPGSSINNVQILVPIQFTFIPGFNMLKSIDLVPNLVDPTKRGIEFTIGNFRFNCNSGVYDPLVNPVINTPGPVQNHIVGIIQDKANTALATLISSLISKFDTAVTQFLVQYKIIDPTTGDVLISSPQQLAALYVQYLVSVGTSPIVVAILQQGLALGIQYVSLFFNWQPVSYTCISKTIPAPSGCITYATSQLQPLVGVSSVSEAKMQTDAAIACAECKTKNTKSNKKVKQQTKAKPLSSNGTTVNFNLATEINAVNFTTRSAARTYCINNKQGFQCSAQGQGCVPTATAAGSAYIYDPTLDNVDVFQSCASQCVGQACGIANNQCMTVDRCNFNNDPSSILPPCDVTTIRAPGQECSKMCPAFNLNGDGTGECTAAIGGSFYNDPTCGQGGPTTLGACMIDAGYSKSCYDKYPIPNDPQYTQGAPMTSAMCSNLGSYIVATPVFIPRGTCSSQQCQETTPGGGIGKCDNQALSCLRFPIVPTTQGGSGTMNTLYTDWTPSQCPSTCTPGSLCTPIGSTAANATGICTTTPSGNVCKTCGTPGAPQCPAGYQCVNSQCVPVSGQCKSNADCGPGQLCDQSQLPYKCVDAATVTGSCVSNSYGVQTCYSQFPIISDPNSNYSQGDPMTLAMCNYLSPMIGPTKFRPNVQCQETCPTSTQCAGGTTCYAYPGSANSASWSSGSCP